MRTTIEEFQERRQRVFNLIEKLKQTTVSFLSSETGFSRSEVVFHLVSFTKLKEDRVDFTLGEEEVLSSWGQFYKKQKRVDDFEEMMGIRGMVRHRGEYVTMKQALTGRHW